MEYEEKIPDATKLCPYCAEIIQSAAIKCRYCGEFLNKQAAGVENFPELKGIIPQTKPSKADNTILFEATPSMWLLLGVVIKSAVIIAFLMFMAFWAVEKIISAYPIDEQVAEAIMRYRIPVAIGVSLFVLLVVVYKTIALKSVRYTVTPDRVEWSRGIFDRRVDNIDMFRIVDLRLRRTIIDCMVGIGSVVLITKDQTDPEFQFKKLRRPRLLYDIIKTASLEADTNRGVVHLE